MLKSKTKKELKNAYGISYKRLQKMLQSINDLQIKKNERIILCKDLENIYLKYGNPFK